MASTIHENQKERYAHVKSYLGLPLVMSCGNAERDFAENLAQGVALAEALSGASYQVRIMGVDTGWCLKTTDAWLALAGIDIMLAKQWANLEEQTQQIHRTLEAIQNKEHSHAYV